MAVCSQLTFVLVLQSILGFVQPQGGVVGPQRPDVPKRQFTKDMALVAPNQP